MQDNEENPMSESYPANFVIAVGSVSGGGKTTLVKKTAELLNAPWLLFDEYKTVSQYPKDLRKWLDDGADMNEWKTPQFARDVAALKRGESVSSPKEGRVVQPSEYVVIEEPMGRARTEMAPYIDFVAVIDTPLEIALCRGVMRDAGHWLVDEPENATKTQLVESQRGLWDYLRGYLGYYLYALRDFYSTQYEQAAATSDLVLDGQLPADDLAQQLVAAVKKTRQE
jgi:hypothetical protein